MTQAKTTPAPLKDLPEEEYNKKWAQEASLNRIKFSKDPRFGDIVICKTKAGDTIFMKEKVASSKKEATNDIV
jgi:hypothetical protein